MTIPTLAVGQPVPDVLLPLPARPPAPPVSRHRGCYWDHEQGAWRAHAPLPLPRPAPE
ncbi:hypothetical protein [Geodermatophilus sabuli]|uniref:Uncharacterized protein n=1 Tax=Geodermatophilus sabuli TaxID=1564158 RepID=A0A285EAD8_9ACTN|nr:hypothetical protein [Geodermatophilus sabuli]MBB3085623.1 hypothetical protein [Geodermatophilus sabuli]SNX95957.1 hypothetical protein SAMN06893097_103126 [Geodermatophilus sabuli]